MQDTLDFLLPHAGRRISRRVASVVDVPGKGEPHERFLFRIDLLRLTPPRVEVADVA